MSGNQNSGRTSTFTQEIADAICERLADGESLRSICSEEDMPSKATVFRWLAVIPVFCDQYAHARETQADSIFDDILNIVDTPLIGEKTKVDKDGKVIETLRGDMIEHRRLQVDARKWMAGKLRPRKYGEKLDLNVSGSLDAIPEEQLDARITELLGKAGVGTAPGGEGEAEGSEPSGEV